MPAEVRSHSHGQTMVVSLHNPEYGNALEPGMYAAAVEALNAAGDNPDVRSAVIVGAGESFCAGARLQQLAQGRGGSRAQQAEAVDGLHLLIDAVSTFPKPVIAAVEGKAAGSGFSLALACDMVVAARDAVFVLSQARLGLTPDGGATWHLARSLPRALALEIALLGERLTAERLYETGLVNRLTATGEALDTALRLAEALNRRAPAALAATRELLARAPSSTLSQQLGAERECFLDCLAHPHAGIGIDAVQHRKESSFD
ncbi:enoyl-CoA hydratase [Xylophilus rhododendri]|uniref:Enoyl-CoA hydratase n=1 Tax=Xylophilus rhododendri TaxID=2697032 RepID=A0A857J081_9BURK|nr:enoyl-CoA hydratase family protein [Xylophilus rhododendri]QHI97270.1 enoyl-CoA hydratase [Xylophilus rhododendri]